MLKIQLKCFWCVYNKPGYGEIYNAGGGRSNSISVLEAISLTNHIANKKWKNFSIKKANRIGDHIWYVTDYSKFKRKYLIRN